MKKKTEDRKSTIALSCVVRAGSLVCMCVCVRWWKKKEKRDVRRQVGERERERHEENEQEEQEHRSRSSSAQWAGEEAEERKKNKREGMIDTTHPKRCEMSLSTKPAREKRIRRGFLHSFFFRIPSSLFWSTLLFCRAFVLFFFFACNKRL